MHMQLAGLQSARGRELLTRWAVARDLGMTRARVPGMSASARKTQCIVLRACVLGGGAVVSGRRRCGFWCLDEYRETTVERAWYNGS